jgi:hypothetical protein
MKNYKKILMGIMLLCLFLPLLQEELKMVEILSLKGAIVDPPKPGFHFSKWFEGTFQKEEEAYQNEKFGFRPLLIRLNNQIAFSFFNEAKAKGVIIGKEKYLYEENYIKAYYGKDFIGSQIIVDRLEKIKYLQDTLKKKNIDLIVIYASGKGSYFPEFIPEEYKTHRDTTNFETYVKKSKELGINHIDMYSYFIREKLKSKYPLYPKYGIHWSAYADFVVTDTLIRYIENLKKADLPELKIHSVVVSDSLRWRDYDVAEGMNLLFKLPSQKLAYPEYSFQEEHKIKPKALLIGDSFFWGIIGMGLANKFLTYPEFFYYANELYLPDKPTKPREQIDLKSLIESQSLIIILTGDANLPHFGWSFINDAYMLYGKDTSKINTMRKEEKIKKYISQILNTPDWLDDLTKKAKTSGTPLDSIIRANAIYMVETEK